MGKLYVKMVPPPRTDTAVVSISDRINAASSPDSRIMGKLYVEMVPPADLNGNTEWFTYTVAWTRYILILFFAWLVVLSVTNCTPCMALTVVNVGQSLLFKLFGKYLGTRLGLIDK